MDFTETQSVPCQSVYFWGVRGTMPTPYKKCLNSGGHTSCIEVNATNSDGTQAQLLIDAGTGIVPAGDTLLLEGVRKFNIYISHFHYDHIFGLTKFSPLYRKDCTVNIIAVKRDSLHLKEIFKNFFSFPFFPLTFENIEKMGNIQFTEVLPNEKIFFSGLELSFLKLNHPQDSFALKTQHASSGTSLVYATDHEHISHPQNELKNFVRDASVLIYDSTFHNENYMVHKGWGHSTGAEGAQLARSSNCLDFILFHHDYGVTDSVLSKIHLHEAKKIFVNSYLAKEWHHFKLRAHVQESSKKPKKIPRGFFS